MSATSVQSPAEPVGSPPSVTVILVVRNGERFIAQALESILGSRRRPTEILVVDGASTDATVSIAQGFALVRIVAQTGCGIPDAYNQGIDEASGRYLAFISHDDLWLPGKLDIQLDYLERHPETDAVLCQVEHFLEPGVACPPGFRPELLGVSRPGWIMEALTARAEVFARIGGFDRGFSVSEDSDWFARALDAGARIEVLPDRLVRKRVYGGNATLTGPLTNAMLLKAMRASIQRKRARSGDD